MTWPIPQPEAIAERTGAAIEQAFEGGEIRVDARSPNTVLGVLARVFAMAVFDLWLHQRALAEELMPDTATGEALARHADVWGITRLPAAAAVGNAAFTGADGTVLPAGIELRAPSGALYVTTEAAAIAAGTATVPIRAAQAGAAGNLAAGAVLSLVSPVAGLSPQTATVAEGGLAGGADAEEDEALRARLLARIRQPPHGGAAFDYEAWARAASPEVAHVAVHPSWVGPGSVGVVVGMRGPRAPTAAELDLVAAAIEARRPVTAEVVVLAAVPLPVDVALVLDPDTVQTRAAVQAALEAYFARDARIGAKLPRSRLSEAISSAAGEYSHQLIAPAADVEPGPTELPVLGTLTFQVPA